MGSGASHGLGNQELGQNFGFGKHRETCARQEPKPNNVHSQEWQENGNPFRGTWETCATPRKPTWKDKVWEPQSSSLRFFVQWESLEVPSTKVELFGERQNVWREHQCIDAGNFLCQQRRQSQFILAQIILKFWKYAGTRTQQLILDQSLEILNVSTTEWTHSPEWDLLWNDQVINWVKAQVRVYSDSVLCVGKMYEHTEANAINGKINSNHLQVNVQR